jgi:hypothetical protein
LGSSKYLNKTSREVFWDVWDEARVLFYFNEGIFFWGDVAKLAIIQKIV